MKAKELYSLTNYDALDQYVLIHVKFTLSFPNRIQQHYRADGCYHNVLSIDTSRGNIAITLKTHTETLFA